jgi:CDP-diacylglycerol--inositol 3-phosphatidyltransferase
MSRSKSKSPSRRTAKGRSGASGATSVTDVYLYAPNLIGYTRIALLIAAFSVAGDNAVLFYACYFVSSWLDAVDGHVARLYGQSSRFGAVLDMLTDRCATASLCVVLAGFFPAYASAFRALIALDFASHYTHMYATLLLQKESHKQIDPSQNWFLRLYYHNRLVLGLMCAANEGFFLSLYMVHFLPGTVLPLPLVGPTPFFVAFTALCFPFMVVKQILSVIQWHGACQEIARFDAAAANAKAAH